ISLEGEFNALATELDSSGVSGLSTYAHDFIHNYLTVHGDNDEVVPQLAAQLPSLDDGTWKVLPDGGMEVTWKLRHGVRWHDGTELTSDDLRFSWEVGKDQTTLLSTQGIARYVVDVATPDTYTAVFTWANASQLGALAG